VVDIASQRLFSYVDVATQCLKVAELTMLTVPPGLPDFLRAGNSVFAHTPPVRSAAFSFMTEAVPSHHRAIASDMFEK